MPYADRIKEIIEQKRLIAKDVAEKANISPVYLSYIMNKKRQPSLEVLKAIAKALNVSFDELMTGQVQSPEIRQAIEDFYYDSDDQKESIFVEEAKVRCSDIEDMAAHHDGDDWTPEELEEIERFKEFVKSKRSKV